MKIGLPACADHPKKPTMKKTKSTGKPRFAVTVEILAACLAISSSFVHGQTTLSGDHVITGNLAVGTSLAPRDLNVKGRAILGGGYVDSFNSVALTMGISRGENSTAMSGATSHGFYSVGMSEGYVGEGAHFSTAMSGGEVWGEEGLTAMSGGVAYGNYSVAIGLGVWTPAAYCVAVGTFNANMEGNPDLWVDTDPLFVIGNGIGTENNDPEHEAFHNAFVVRKNGDVEMTGKIKMPRQGDILMGEFSGQ